MISHTVNPTIWSHRQFRVTFRKTYLFFFRNDIVFQYSDYPVLFPNLLAASNLMLDVETLFTNVVIKKRLTAPLPGKVKVPENCLDVNFFMTYLLIMCPSSRTTIPGQP